MKGKLFCLILAFSFWSSTICNAQGYYYYTFSQYTSPYSPISTDSSLLLYEDSIHLGFNINIAGESGSTLYVFTSAGSIANESSGIFNFPVGYMILGTRSYVIEGSTGHHIIKIQFENAHFSVGPPSDFLNFQFWLYEVDGTIEIHMGTSLVTNVAADFNSGKPECFWNDPSHVGFIVGNVTSPTLGAIVDTLTDTIGKLSGLPANGVVFKFSHLPSGIVSVPGNQEPLTIYPMPCKNVGYINDSLQTDLNGKEISIFDLNGRLIKKEIIRNNSFKLEQLPSGVYTGTILYNDNVFRTKIIVMQ